MGYLVGIVGKPNVGKSTFFSAATLIPVPIANYPFTTIKPNRGVGYVRVKCVCQEFGVKDNPVNSICINGERFIPVELIDCAGLVPDAWKGRGLGNQFLDEIRQANALIHVIDASGGTDEEGRICELGSHNPLNDVQFLEKEIDMWLFQIISRDWSKISKSVETTKIDLSLELAKRLSGLGIKKEQINEALKKCNLNPKEPNKWSENSLLNFIHELRVLTKPMLLAANKADLPTAASNIENIKKQGYLTIPCSAEAELALRKAAEKNFIKYLPGNSDFEVLNENALQQKQKEALNFIKEKVLKVWGSTGVQEAINAAFFKLLKMNVVYPVEDPERLTDKKGNVLPDAYLVPYGTTAKEFAGIIHSELEESFIYAIEVRSKRRVGEDYILKNNDVISIISSRKRA
ncbi:MAG: redox-regulated ATPase YchF [Candidatus Bathyarchaeia archaeon]|nr:redox-regulated ATPase YchF [Candidatus Bathyarchaeota archaeon]